MKPVLIQHLIRNNKGKYKATPTTKEDQQHYNDRAAGIVLWFLGIIVFIGLLAN